jgi:hypothetical protein
MFLDLAMLLGTIMNVESVLIKAVSIAGVTPKELQGLVDLKFGGSLGVMTSVDGLASRFPAILMLMLFTIRDLIDAILLFDGGVNGSELLRREVESAFRNTFSEGVVRAETIPLKTSSRPRADTFKAVRSFAFPHGVKDAREHGFEGDDESADFGCVFGLGDGTVSQEDRTSDSIAFSVGLSNVARDHLAGLVLMTACPVPSVVASSRADVEASTLLGLLENEEVDTPNVLWGTTRELVEPRHSGRRGRVKDIEKTAAESKTSRRQLRSETLASLEDIVEAGVDVAAISEASPEQSSDGAQELSRLPRHPDT